MNFRTSSKTLMWTWKRRPAICKYVNDPGMNVKEKKNYFKKDIEKRKNVKYLAMAFNYSFEI